MIEEIWKPIPNYEGLYEVSNKCRVRTIDHYVNNRLHNGMKIVHGRIKRLCYSKDKRPFVELSKEGINKKYPVYRVMAMAFIPNPNNLPEINHIDENPSNNNLENLEWCDRKYNINYGTRTIRSIESKYRPVIASKDGIPFMIFKSSKEAALVLNVSVSLISMAIHKNRKAKGLNFKVF